MVVQRPWKTTQRTGHPREEHLEHYSNNFGILLRFRCLQLALKRCVAKCFVLFVFTHYVTPADWVSAHRHDTSGLLLYFAVVFDTTGVYVRTYVVLIVVDCTRWHECVAALRVRSWMNIHRCLTLPVGLFGKLVYWVHELRKEVYRVYGVQSYCNQRLVAWDVIACSDGIEQRNVYMGRYCMNWRHWTT